MNFVPLGAHMVGRGRGSGAQMHLQGETGRVPLRFLGQQLTIEAFSSLSNIYWEEDCASSLDGGSLGQGLGVLLPVSSGPVVLEMVQGCGRRKGLVTGRTALVGAGIQPGLLGPKGSLIPISHQRLGLPSPLPHHHHHTEKQTLLQFLWQRISLRFNPSPSQRLQGRRMCVCVCARTRMCVYLYKCVGENQTGEEAKQVIRET